MNRNLLAGVLLVGLISPLAAQNAPRKVIGYYTSWSIYRRNYQVHDIPATMLTHLNYAFANVVNGQAVLGDPVADLQNFVKLAALKKLHPNLKILLSVGGWTWSSGFSDAVLTPTSRQTFAASCVSLMTTYGLDGLDIDWEWPVGGGLPTNTTRPQDKQNYTLFLAELRRQLILEGTKQQRTFLLSVTAPGSPMVMQNVEIAKIVNHVDWLSLMTWGYHGPWDPGIDLTGFSAALYPDPKSLFGEPARSKFNVSATVKAYLDLGVPRNMMEMGFAFYGTGFSGVYASKNGLYGLYTGASPGTWSPGFYDYSDLKQNYINQNGYQRYHHAEARVPWLFNPTTQIMISYEDPQSIREKAWLAKAAGLDGVMFWDLSSDRNKELLTPLVKEVNDVVTLRAPVRTISIANPARIDLLIESDATRAGRWHYVVGSLSGTTPGFPVGGGVLPVNFDILTLLSLWTANGPLFVNTIGTLDAAGSAKAGFNVAALGALPPSLAGTWLHFAAWVAISNTSLAGEPTNPVSIQLQP